MLHSNFKKITLIVLLISLISFNGFSNTVNEKDNINNLRGLDWQLYQDVNGIQIYFKLSECNDSKRDKHVEYLLIKVINTTEKDFELRWKNEYWYDDKCHNCESNSKEYLRKIIIKSGESIEGECSNNTNYKLRIHSKFLNYDLEKLTKFEMKNVQVIPVE